MPVGKPRPGNKKCPSVVEFLRQCFRTREDDLEQRIFEALISGGLRLEKTHNCSTNIGKRAHLVLAEQLRRS